ncbi:MAG TPA: amino acid adenylation domain-containing protein [Thermoanaerobaculia bacterium]|nr:amino acid adenylation domain-containing protein [Thermoanaerobaculia bacterium]
MDTPPAPRPDRAPPSFGQEALWFLSRLAPASRAYHLCGAARLLVSCDAGTGEAVARAFAALAEHHPALRTIFGEGEEGAPEQRVGGGPGLAFSHLVVDTSEALSALLAGQLDAPFDLERGPLVRAGLITIGTGAEGETVLWLAAHHLVADFWSLAVMLRDVGIAYAGGGDRQALLAAETGEPQLSYAEWARWQRERTASAEGERELAAWRESLAGELPRLELPTDRPRRAKVTWDGGAVDVRVSAEAVHALGRFARGAKSNLFSALLTAFQAFLARLSGQDDLIVGTPTTGRFGARVADQVGYFVNPVPVRADLSGDPSFLDLLLRQKPAIQAALGLQGYPFSRLAEEIQPERDAGRSPIFDAMLAYEKARGGEGFWGFALGQAGTRVDLGGLGLESLRVEPTGSPFDLSLAVSEVAGGLAGSLRFSSELFDRATIERWAHWLVRLIEGVAAEPGRRLSDLPLLSSAERAALIASGASGPSAGAHLSGDPARLDDGFSRWEEATPEALAVADARERWSYRELGALANRLAHHLRALGVAEESRVALCLDRSASLVATMLGVLRAGAAFVPIDPAYPEARRAAMIESSEAAAVVTTESYAGPWCGAASVVLFDALSGAATAPPPRWKLRSDPDQLAYVIFTSGSTGTPKGVAISHRAALHMVAWYGRFGWLPADRGSQIAGPGFDATVLEIWPALAAGASLHVPPDEVRLSPSALLSWLAAEQVTVAFLPTPLAEAAFAESLPESLALRYLNVGGDRLHRGAPAAWSNRKTGFRLVNMYGPAENAVVTTASEVPADDPNPSIGRPIDGVRVYLLDRHLGLAPPGCVGEIAAAGPGLARGYLGDPAQTAERFRPDPFASLSGGEPGDRMYRTGDLARFRPTGEIDFLGRLDTQVKIRGQRIELGEIESALASLPGIREATVLVHEATPGDRRLVAFVVLSQDLADAELIEPLRRRLSDAMVPRTFVRLDRLPANANGKVDRRALSLLAARAVAEAGASGGLEEGTAPSTEMERRVAEIWQELLGRERVGVEDDFFALGGHSLLVTQLASRLRRAFGIEFPLAELFSGATVASIAARVEKKLTEGEAVERIERAARPEDVPLSFSQERLWFVDRLEPGRATYNVGFRLTLAGPLSASALEAALAAVIARHEPLRTRYAQPGDVARQEIDPPSLSLFVSWPQVDLAGGLGERASTEAARIAKAEGRRPFDLARGPVVRAVLVKRGPALHDAIFTFHHIAIDGWSLAVFSREIAELYAASTEGRRATLPPLLIDYADWAIWQRGWLTGERYERELAWWRDQLKGAPEALDLPADRPRPTAPKRAGWQVRRHLPLQLSIALNARANAESSTPFMTLLAAWAGLFSRLGSGPDLVIGTPIANRNRAETEGLIGFFVNSLAVRIAADSSPTLRSLLATVREASVGAFAHQDFPFERLVAELGGSRAGNMPPIYQVSFAFQNLPAPVMLPGLSTTVEELDGGAAKLDLGLVVTPVEDRFVAQLELNLDLFDPATGARLLAGFERMAAELAAHPERLLAEAELLEQAERQQLLTDWNDADVELPPVLVHDFIARHALERPDALALESEHEPGRRYTWAEIEAHTNRLARRLAGLGAGPEKVVGVSLERSVDRALAMYAIWKAGACYLPVDPELPEERRALLLSDARAVVLIARDVPSGLIGLSGTVAPLLLSKEDGLPVDGGPEEVPRAALPENLAYVIYTSGSTGVPKGVGISHRHAAGHFAAAAGFYRMDSSDRVVQFASASFDVSMEQMGVALASGGTLVVRGPDLPPPLELSAWMSRFGITNANLPTAVWTEWSWSDAPLPHCLRVLVTGGEAMTPAAAERFRQRLAEMENSPVVYNGYGPTETVVTATCYDLRYGRLSESGSVSIGHLLPRRSGYVVDAAGRPQTLGGVGELVLGGLLARGYLDRPDLTAERFRPDPFGETFGARTYWTGDRIRQRGDGSFDYLGRTDQQIKIRGFRIEPGEIEAALGQHPGIKEAIVLAREAPSIGKRLIAWYRPMDGEIVPADLRRFLAGRLPEYMVPAAFVEVADWPLTPTGKVDRRALPDPIFESGGGARIALKTPTEEIIAGLFAELLGGSEMGAEADFFALGGHSLLATQLASRLRRTFGVELPLAELFAGSTVAAIAERIDALAGGPQAPPLVRMGRAAEEALSFAEERLWFLDRLAPGTSTYNVGFRLTLDGPLAIEPFVAALSAVVDRHARLRTRFGEREGKPYATIERTSTLSVPRIDLSGLAENDEAARLASKEGRRPFDLARGPLLRVSLLRRSTDRHDALFVFHHIVTDGWSISVFSREVAELYAAAIEERPAALAPLPIEVADWAAWQRGWLSGEVYDAQLAWWRERLAGAPDVLELPVDRPRPASPKNPAWLMRRELPSALFSAVAARSRAAGATPFMVLLAAWAGLLSRLGAGRDLVVGTAIANRNRAETEGLIGFFINSLSIRIAAEAKGGHGGPPLRALLSIARDAALGAYAHQDFPLDRLVAELGGVRGGNAPPIFQVSLVFQNLPEPVLLPGLVTTIEPLGGGVAKLDLALVVSPVRDAGGERLSALLEIDLDLFDPATGARLLRGFEAMVGQVAAHPERLLAEAELLGPSERHQLLTEWREGDLALPPVLVHDWIARQARERPGDLALESEHEPGRRYSWAELAAHTDALARRLAGLGAGPERVVGVSLERSVDRALAMYAIWKAGACYLPVDPELPVERRALLLADAGAVVLIAREMPSEVVGLSGTVAPLLLSQEDGLPVDGGPEEVPRAALPESLAYVIYTSGSTGVPKGVGISHRAAAGHFAAASGFYRMDASDRVVQFASASFDVSMEQVGVALASGGTLVVRGPDLPPPLELSAWMTRWGITNANLPTAVWTEWSWSDASLPRQLRVLVTGGEAMTPAAAERFRLRLAEMDDPPVVYNGYGPTETVVTATCYDLRFGRLPDSGSVSIGRLLPRRSGFVADEAGEPQALGGVGELLLGGLLARGYLDRPDLTAERFRPDPFAEKAGARVYRTGDRARQRGDGSFDYLGRTDQQIKIRGFRIEPGEVEAALAQHPSVKEAIVIAQEVPGVSGIGKRLIAWVRPLGGALDPSELRRFLLGRLPEYMVPGAFVEVSEWPLTPTGKVDRRALPDPTFDTGERMALRTPTEEIVAGLFAELLGASDLGAESDFFALGGHSLLATQLASRLRRAFGVELPLAELFAGSTVAGIAERIDALAGRPHEALAPIVRGVRPSPPADIPLSFAQERLWFLDRLEPGTATYNVGFRLALSGPLTPDALAAALAALVARHEPLRTRFVLVDDRPTQRIEPAGALPLPGIDLGGLGNAEASVEAERLAAAEGRRPFDLARGPVLRSTLVRLAPDRHEALFVFHHIATDGWSIGIFSRELVDLYAAAVSGRPSILPPLPIDYADWALWQRGWLAGEVYDRQLAEWRERLSGAPEVLDLPLDCPRPIVPTRRAHTMRRELSVELSAAVARRSRETGTTPYMVLLAAWAGLLSRLGAGRDLVIGLPIANRNRAETEGLVGFFVNTLAIRISAEPAHEGELLLGELLARARAAALGAYAGQDFPFDRLVAELAGARGGGIPPIFQVSLVLQNLPEPVLLPGLSTTVEELGGGLAKLDLGLAVVPLREAGIERLSALLELNLDLFDPTTGARLLRGFEAMLQEIAAHPERALAEADLVGQPERHQLLVEWNDSDLALPPFLVHDFIARHARERPDDPALESEHEPRRRYTWAELAAHTDRLARRVAGLGAGPEQVVGVSLERSVDRALAIYSIWKAGACYLPVDPELPVERRALLLSDAKAVVLIAREEFFADLPSGLSGLNGTVAPLLLRQEDGLPVDSGPEEVPRAALPENLAYVIYTSGSTGVPKGVGISHRHAAGHFAAAAGFYRMDSTDRVVQFAAASFDVSMEQVGVALASGGTLVVRGPELPPPLELSAWMTRHGITNANLPTAVWTEWSRSEAPLPRCLRVLVTGGEAMTPAAAERFRARLAEMADPPVVYNGYGPTETVVTATCYDLGFGRLPESGAVSIGRSLPRRLAVGVDAAGRPQPVGGVGELVLGGLLARGYLDRPELTAERFRPDPFAENAGARVYWTGDRVRQRGDGSFDYLGRTDHQIKVRGFRIEPGEIEAAMAQHPGVQDAIVLAREVPGAGPRLVAWYRPLGETSAAADLRTFLAARLPEYMVPAAFVEVAEWPISATGKIDRRALPEPQRLAGAERTPPRTPIQQVIADLWREALPEIGDDLAIEDNFFELGGHSLLAVRITSKVAANFQVELPLKRLFEAPTIAGLEAAVLAGESRPGQSEKIARVLLRLKSLSPEAKEKLLAGR